MGGREHNHNSNNNSKMPGIDFTNKCGKWENSILKLGELSKTHAITRWMERRSEMARANVPWSELGE